MRQGTGRLFSIAVGCVALMESLAIWPEESRPDRDANRAAGLGNGRGVSNLGRFDLHPFEIKTLKLKLPPAKQAA